MNYVVTKQMKSRGIAALLVFLFGGFGIFYSSIMGGLVMGIIAPLAIILSFLFGLITGSKLLITLLLIFCCLYYIICFIWAIRAVESYNNKILKEVNLYNYKNSYNAQTDNSIVSAPTKNEQEIKDSYHDLDRINSLRFSKVITDEQYNQQKENILTKIKRLKQTNVLPNNGSAYIQTTSYNRNFKNKIWIWLFIFFLIFSLLYVLYDSKTNSLKFDKITSLFSSQLPTEDMALEKLKVEQFDDETKNFIEIIDFKKTDGVKTNIFGVEGYVFSYSLKAKLKQNTHIWDLDNFKNFKTNEEFYKALKEGLLNKYDDKDFYEEHKKGEIIYYTGSINFEKTENGWH